MKLNSVTRTGVLVAAVCGVLACQSCTTPSVYTVAPEAPPAKADWAVGTWRLAPDSVPPDEDKAPYAATIVARGDRQYSVEWKPSTNATGSDLTPFSLVARPFELGGRLFADVMLSYSAIQEVTKKYPALVIPTHVLARIDRVSDDSATLSLPVYAKAQELAARQNRPLPMVMSDSDQRVPLALTGDSQAITAFYEANAGSDELFALKLKFVRVKAEQPPAPGASR